MTDKGRAAFNVRHIRHGEGNAKGKSGTTGDRRRLLEEMMRELDDKWAQHHASRNPNIVLDETHKNISAKYNPDDGGWYRASSVDEIVAYGEERAARVGRKIGANSFETTTLVVHLPRTLCKEVPDYYPVYTEDGQVKHDKDGNELRRSRWVARDETEATDYLLEATEWIADNVLPGGRAAIHGFNIQFDESTPHVQVMADTFAEHPDKPGVLRVEASQAWGSHRDVRYPEGHPQAGQQMGGNQKMRMYQQGLREHMHSLGYDVELDVSERAHESLDKDRYAAEDDSRRVLEADQEILLDAKNVLNQEIKRYDGHFSGVAKALAEREKAVEDQESLLPKLRKKAREDGYEAGRSQGLEEAEAEAARIKAQAREEAQREAQRAAQQAERVRQDAKDEAKRIKQDATNTAEKAQREAQQAREEAQRVRQDAETAIRQSRAQAYQATVDAKNTLSEVEDLLASTQVIANFDPSKMEVDTRESMKQVDADFLDGLCEKHPKIQQMRKQAHSALSWKNQAQIDTANRTVGENRQRAQRYKQQLNPSPWQQPKSRRQAGDDGLSL